MPEFTWTQNTLLAAQLVAEGDLTYPQIAERADTTRNTLYLWRKNPEFAERVAEIREEFRQAIRNRGIANLEKRIEAQNERWRKLQRVISARAEDPAYHEVAGGDTGLLGRVAKWVGSGDNREFVVEFELDAALLREIRELEKQAAIELGQWNETKKSQDSDETWQKALTRLGEQLNGGNPGGGPTTEPGRSSVV